MTSVLMTIRALLDVPTHSIGDRIENRSEVEVALSTEDLIGYPLPTVGLVDAMPMPEHLVLQNEGGLIEDHNIDRSPETPSQCRHPPETIARTVSKNGLDVQQQGNVNVAVSCCTATRKGPKKITSDDFGVVCKDTL
jgi:hypothetical protein